LSKLLHLGVEYDIAHLDRGWRQFEWASKFGQFRHQKRVYNVSVSYENHCYSEEIRHDYEANPGELVMLCSMNTNKRRLFHPIRHAMSLELIEIVEDLFRRPQTMVKRVDSRANYRHFRLQLNTVRMERGVVYNVFFDGRRQHDRFTMRVQSAYAKPTAANEFAGLSGIMFGDIFALMP
jgi:hypothetical protein